MAEVPRKAGSEVNVLDQGVSSRTRTAGLFDRLAGRYDAWYEGPAGGVLLPLEVATLAPLLGSAGRPRLEIGVGSGRFAQALGVEVGLDPAPAPLVLARGRGVAPVLGVGERLPFLDGAFGAVLMVVTLCFADDPAAMLVEARRVLAPGGRLVLGMVFAGSPWGEWYRRKGEEGHPFYSAARFLGREAVAEMLRGSGFRVVAARSTLLQPPSDAPVPEPVLEGDVAGAGFVGLAAM
jgi:SAM-dependent methyltransferase